MKLREYLRQPGVKWVNHSPRTDEICLAIAIPRLYPREDWDPICRKIQKLTSGFNVVEWNNTHTYEEVLALVDELDI